MIIYYFLIIFNVFILESILSVDNSAVLAILVKDLPSNQRTKSLRYGILGAYILRGLCLFLTYWLIKILWLKIIGGIYLLYLTYKFIVSNSDNDEPKINNKVSIFGLNEFISTIILVEVMDLAFSIDNIFAVIALSSNIYLIIIGVAFGILAMRFIASWFVSVMEKYPKLESASYVVISLLGIKLIFSGLSDYIYPFSDIRYIMQYKYFDFIFSIGMIIIFFLPIFFKKKL